MQIEIAGQFWKMYHPRHGEVVTVLPAQFERDGYNNTAMIIVEVDGLDYLLRSERGHPDGDVWMHAQRIEGTPQARDARAVR